MKRIEFGTVKINDISKRHVQDCLDTNWCSMGKKVKLFEEKFKNLFNYEHCRAVSSGTSADIASLLVLYDKGAEQGDEVIVPALGFIATANAVRAAGFTPVFVDVKRETLNINEDLIEAAITKKTRAIISVNTMGRPCELDKISAIAKGYKLLHIVDNCEAYGSWFKGKFALSYADIETTSHYTAHLCSGGAEGGTVLTNDPEIDAIIESVRSHGRVGGSLFFNHVRYGLNLKQTDIHAALLLGEVDPSNFWSVFQKRRYNWTYIREKLRGLENVAYFSEEDKGNVNCPHGFSVLLKQNYAHHNEAFRKFLDEKSIHWKKNFGAIPEHKAFDYLELEYPTWKKFPEAYFAGEGIHVGTHQFLSQEDVEYLANSIKEFLGGLL